LIRANSAKVPNLFALQPYHVKALGEGSATWEGAAASKGQSGLCPAATATAAWKAADTP